MLLKFRLLLPLLLLFIFSCKKETTPNKSSALQISTVYDPADTVKINQIQSIASHNSYRIRTADTILTVLNVLKNILPGSYNPDDLDYTHPAFEQQMNNYPVRGLEIDFFNDPNGGAFYYRHMNALIGIPEASGIESLKLPGMKVLHIKDVDYETNYLTLVDALRAVKAWSDAHPRHIPLYINFQSNSEAPGDYSQLVPYGFGKAIPFDASAADKIDIEIKSVFGEDLTNIMTPDRLRKNLATPNEVVTKNQWPTLGETRGKIFFIMEGPAVPYYLKGHPNLENRAAFVYANADNPAAAFLLLNDPLTSEATITSMVKQGYFVRTRADESTTPARTGDYSKMNAALRSGAQIISTDYYRADPRSDTSTAWSTYHVSFPNGDLARLNPVTGAYITSDLKIKE